MYKGQSVKFHPMRDTLRTIYYLTVNGEKVSFEKVMNIHRNSSFKPRNVRGAVMSMLKYHWIKLISDRVFLTDKGLQYVEKIEKLLSMTIYGKLLMNKHMSREDVDKLYANIARKIVGPTFENKTKSILRRLKHEGVIDYTNKRVWVVKQIKIRKE